MASASAEADGAPDVPEGAAAPAASSEGPSRAAGDIPVPADPWDEQDPWQGAQRASPSRSSPPQLGEGGSSAWSVIGGPAVPPGTWAQPMGPPVTYGPAWPWQAAATQPYGPMAGAAAAGPSPPHLPVPPPVYQYHQALHRGTFHLTFLYLLRDYLFHGGKVRRRAGGGTRQRLMLCLCLPLWEASGATGHQQDRK